MGYTVILPTLNEKGHIVELVREIQTVFSSANEEYEIIVVDDTSEDGTIDLIKKIENDHNNLKLFVRENLKRNLAKSINQGIEKSKHENIIWMDADFQHPPDHIKLFYEYQKKYDVVIFSRFLKDSVRYFDKDSSKKEVNENQSIFFNKLCKFFLYKDITDYTSGFICVKKKVLKNYTLNGNYGEYFIGLITHFKKNNYSVIEIPFKEGERYSGHSKTIMNYSLKYIIICSFYFLSLVKNYFRKFF